MKTFLPPESCIEAIVTLCFGRRSLSMAIYICLPVSFKNRNQRENQYGMRSGIQLAHLLHRKLTKAACFLGFKDKKKARSVQAPKKK